jgi:hypothetical protein
VKSVGEGEKFQFRQGKASRLALLSLENIGVDRRYESTMC